MALSLLLIFFTAFFYHPSLKIILTFGFCLGTTILADLIFLKLRGIKLFYPEAAIVSGTIIGLLSAANIPWYELLLAVTLAMFSKNFLRIQNRHIFNPAGFGLLSSSLIFRHGISWWAASFQFVDFKNIYLILAVIILFLPGLVSLLRMRRFFIFLSFILISFLIQRKVFFDPTTIFFALVMLPEPMTTPIKYLAQIFFGAFVAVVSIVVSYVSFPLDPLIFPLLLGNLLFFKWR